MRRVPGRTADVPVSPNGSAWIPFIHRTLRGDMLESKSDVIVAAHLHRTGVDYRYGPALTLGGETRYPDFIIDDAESGSTYTGSTWASSTRRAIGIGGNGSRRGTGDTGSCRSRRGTEAGTLVTTRDEHRLSGHRRQG